MGRHKEWRKLAKKERRRRIRQEFAKERDNTICCSAEYSEWLKDQETLEAFELEQINKMNEAENEKWLRAEQIAMKQWQRLQEQKELLRLKHLEEDTRRKLEWEQEKEKKRQEEERLKQIEEENKKRQEIFLQHLEEFLDGSSIDPPPELLVSRESKPNCDPCPFFAKTSCCRFGDECSRNHRYPGISKVLLATNFYSHFGLENANKFDTDIMLEYEESDTYREFKDFFYDVVAEFEKFGRIIQFKVCHNYEKHLRGNTYIEFAELRCAVAAYRALHTRWYGGKQLSLQFCIIHSWKNAICGLQSRKRCPKGQACNFLHVFRNPTYLYRTYQSEREQSHNSERHRRSPPRRHWRWSESPELEIRRNRSRSRERRERRRREDRGSRDCYKRDIDSRRRSRKRRRSSERKRDRSDRTC